MKYTLSMEIDLPREKGVDLFNNPYNREYFKKFTETSEQIDD